MPPTNVESLSRPQFNSRTVVWFGVLLLFASVHVVPILLEVPAPGTDVFIFKEAGVNLALKGKFMARNLPNQPPDRDEVFAYYPPVYPLAYAGWSTLFGVGHRQSLAFDCVVRLLRTFLLFWLILPVLDRASRGRWVFTLALLAAWSFVTTEADRPDDLAVVWGLLAWNLLFRGGGWRRGLGGGLILGLCASTSPTAGVFFTGVAGCWLLRGFDRKKLIPLAALAAGAFVVYFAANLPIHLADPLAYARFKKQVPLSTFPYLKWLHYGPYYMACYYEFRGNFYHYIDVGFPYLCLLGGLLPAAGLAFARAPKEEPSRVILLASVAFVPVCLAVWTLQPFYLWFSITGLLVGVVGALRRFHSSALVRGAAVIALCGFTPLFFREAKSLSSAIQRSPDDSSARVQNRVLPYLPPNTKLAIAPDQYFTFRAAREVSNLYYVCERINDYDFVYITRHQSASVGTPTPIPIPCETPHSCFKVVKDFSTQVTYQMFGLSLPYFVVGNGGVLYRNTCKG
jgi:hypothetical protein